jgi:hypothetical protein
LALSIVPSGQAGAVTITGVAEEGSTITSLTSGAGGINITWGTDYDLSSYNYYHKNTKTLNEYTINNQIGLYSTDSNYNALIIDFTGLANTNTEFTIRQNITNETGLTWKDYHAKFYYKNGSGAWIAFPDLSNKSSDSSQIGDFSWDGVTAHWTYFGDTIPDNGTGYFTVSGYESQLYGLTGADGSIKIELTPTVVPEPNSAMLLGIGGLIGAVMLRRKYAVEA